MVTLGGTSTRQRGYSENSNLAVYHNRSTLGFHDCQSLNNVQLLTHTEILGKKEVFFIIIRESSTEWMLFCGR